MATNILNKQSRTADKGWSSSLGGGGEVLTTPHRKKRIMLQNSQRVSPGPRLIIWYGMDRAGSGKGQVAGTCGNEPSGSITYGEFLDYLKTC